MGFLRRLLGGPAGTSPAGTSSAESSLHEDPTASDADERARELELLHEDQDRLDELTRRQLRYAEYAWEPPAQGGERRADDADTSAGDEA